MITASVIWVIAEYKRQPCGITSEINVIVTDGVVHLWGYVPSEAELNALRKSVEGVPGVKGFQDHRNFGDARPRQRSQIIIDEPSQAERIRTI